MKRTIVTIQPIANCRERKKPTVRTFECWLTDDQVFATLYPRAAALGHTSDSRKNGYNRYSVEYI